MINPHIVRKSTSPISSPPEAGIHWINTATGEEYFSVGTSTINDWVIRKNNGDWLNGSGVPSSSLGNNNDNYINNDNGDYYKKVSGSWVLQGSLKGATGDTGATGATGATGEAGQDGSQIYTGSTNPDALLGQDSDFYVNTTSNEYFQKLAGVWTSLGSFAGVTDHGLLTGLADNDHPQYLLTSNFDIQNETMKEPTGFVNRTDSLLSFNNSSREFTITAASGTFDIYVKGNKYVKGTKALRISEESGNHFIYYDVDGVLSETTSFDPSLFEDNALVSIVYWNNETLKYSYLADERHGLVMDGATHSYLHTVFGARYLSGLALQNFFPDGSGDLAKEAQFEADIGKIRDEDLLIELPRTVEFPVLYRLAENGLWRKKTASEFPVIYNGEEGYSSDGTIAYNEFDGTSWRLTPVGDGDFVLMHIFATNDYETPFVVILGINKYPNTPAARAAADSEISSLSGLPFAEFVAVGTVIFQTDAAYTNTPKARIVSAALGETYVDFRGEQLYTPSGVATSHSLLSNLGSDDHTQYYNEVRGDARYIKQVDDKSFYRISYQKDIFLIQAVSALTAPSVTGGVAVSATGTATAVTTTAASFYTYKKLLSYTASSGSTAIAGWRVIPRTYIHGNTYGGFKFSCGFGFHAGMASGGINRRMFVGFQSSGVAPTDIEPSTVTSCFFFGLDNGDVNIQFMHNDGAGTCTKIDTGLPRPTADQVDFYCVEFLSVAGSSVLNYKIINELNGTMFSGSVSTNLPSNTTALAPRAWLSAGGVSSAVGISMNHIYIET